MQNVDLRLDPQWIVPVESKGVLTGHALLVDAGRIVAIAPVATAAQQYRPRQQIALPGCVLIPGLINAHTHAAMTLFRGIADDLPLQQWLETRIWPREQRFVAPEFVYDGARLAVAEMLKAGVTLCNDMYFFPDATARACLEGGMRAMLGLPVLDFPTAYAADADAYLEAGLEVRDAYRHQPGLSFSLAPHAPYTVGDQAWDKIVMYASQLNLPIQTHLAETANEVADHVARHGLRPLERLHKLGATGPGFIAIHATHLLSTDIELLATQSSHVVHCPASNMKLGSGIAPVAALHACGVNVALGTDGAASNNRLDVLAEMRLAALLAKVQRSDATVLPAEQVLYMATLGGAKALGLADELGSLAPGKHADVIAIDLSGSATMPCYDPISQLVFAAGRECVTDVWIGGRRVLAERMLATVDEREVLARAQAWQERIR